MNVAAWTEIVLDDRTLWQRTLRFAERGEPDVLKNAAVGMRSERRITNAATSMKRHGKEQCDPQDPDDAKDASLGVTATTRTESQT
jgi:hypothetical protein